MGKMMSKSENIPEECPVCGNKEVSEFSWTATPIADGSCCHTVTSCQMCDFIGNLLPGVKITSEHRKEFIRVTQCPICENPRSSEFMYGVRSLENGSPCISVTRCVLCKDSRVLRDGHRIRFVPIIIEKEPFYVSVSDMNNP